MTSLSDLDNGLQRAVSKILSCKNQPAELNPSAMTQQLEEAKVGMEKRSLCVDTGIIIYLFANVFMP